MRKYFLIGASAFRARRWNDGLRPSDRHRRAPASSAMSRPTRCCSLFGDVVDQVQRQYVTPVDEKGS